MPANAIAFVFGVWVLQQQPALLSLSALVVLGSTALALALIAGFAGLTPRWRLAGNLNLLYMVACVACCVLGFA